jgi:hypothetical protein
MENLQQDPVLKVLIVLHGQLRWRANRGEDSPDNGAETGYSSRDEWRAHTNDDSKGTPIL